jgi:hypothetical protein
MREYKVEVTRDGRWWMINVPEIDQLTQARRISEIVPMAESLIAISTDQQVSDITVHIISIEVPGLGDIAARATAITEARNAAIHATEIAQQDAARYAAVLAKAEVPVRDTADLLHVSPQRVSQLAKQGV